MNKYKKRVIATDFDGTIAKHADDFPEIGEEVEWAIDWLLKFQKDYKTKLILWTCRHDNEDSQSLSMAVDWCEEHELKFWAVNDNPNQVIWSQSRKVFAHKYIDDMAWGIPLKTDINHDRPYVDWEMVGPELEKWIKEGVW